MKEHCSLKEEVIGLSNRKSDNLTIKKKKKDYFWPMMILLAIISFVSSYLIFYKLTSKVDTKTISSTKSVIVKETSVSAEPEKTIVIGDGQGSPTPDPNAVVTPEPSGEASQTQVTPTPISTVTPTTLPTVTDTPVALQSKIAPLPSVASVPTPVKTQVAIVPSVSKQKQVLFKVRVGAYDSRSEAEKKVKELEGMGYESTVIDEPEGSYIQLGSFKEQERALGLAEEISQKGYSVIIRQIEE